MTKKDASCYIAPATDLCCDQRWTKFNDTYACTICGDTPDKYRIRMTIDGHKPEFSYTKKGISIKSMASGQAVANSIMDDIANGTFNPTMYRNKNLIGETLADFIRLYAKKRLTLTQDERELLDDFMVPYFGEVGAFAACKIHLYDFIGTFKLKGERRDMAESLFHRVTAEIKI